MAIYAELPNGTRLEFPNGTKQSVIDSVVKKQLTDNPTLFIPQAKIQKNDVSKDNDTVNIRNNQHNLKNTYSQPKTITNNDPLNLRNNQHDIKNTYSHTKTIIGNDPLSLNNSQTPQNNLSTQSKININNTVPATKPQISINPIEQTNYPQQSQTDNSIYFLVVAIIAIVIFFVSKQNNEDTAQNKKSDNNSGSYKFVFVFSILMTILMFFAGAINTSDGSHNSPVGIVLWGYLSWLIYKKNNKKIVNFLKSLLWLGTVILVFVTGFSIFADNTFFIYEIPFILIMSIYYALYVFFKKQLNYESEDSNSRYDNDSQYDYSHKKQQEYTSSSNQNNYKKQYDDTSNNNYQHESKQNEQSYHSKSSDSNQHSTFDDRLDELKSNIAKCYEILEVPQNATRSEIKAAFKKKMSSYHPDKVSGLGEKLRKVAEEESKLINVAYQTLKSKGKC
jgi:hypothetical protein